MIVDEYSARDSRFRVIHQKNSGVEIARNIGLSLANGLKIIFMDGDDVIKDNYLAEHNKILIDAPLDTVTYSANIDMYPDGRQEDWGPRFKNHTNKRDLCLAILREEWCPVIHGWVWPRSILIRGGAWRTDISSNDDLEFAFRHMALGEHFRYVANTRVIYNKHPNGLSHIKRNANFYLSVLEATSSREKFALSIEDSDAMRSAAAQLWYSLLFSIEFVANSYARSYIRLRLSRLGRVKCFLFSPKSKRGMILKFLGSWGLVGALLLRNGLFVLRGGSRH